MVTCSSFLYCKVIARGPLFFFIWSFVQVFSAFLIFQCSQLLTSFYGHVLMSRLLGSSSLVSIAVLESQAVLPAARVVSFNLFKPSTFRIHSQCKGAYTVYPWLYQVLPSTWGLSLICTLPSGLHPLPHCPPAGSCRTCTY